MFLPVAGVNCSFIIFRKVFLWDFFSILSRSIYTICAYYNFNIQRSFLGSLDLGFKIINPQHWRRMYKIHSFPIFSVNKYNK